MTRGAPALSTIAARNPTRAVQPPRKRGKSGKSNASRATNTLATNESREKRLQLEQEVEDHVIDFQAKVTSLSIKYGRKENYIKKLLGNSAQYAQKRGLNIRNAIMHDLSVKAKEAGDKGDLKTIRTNLSKEEYQEMKAEMTEEEHDRLMKQLAEHRGFKHRGVRATNKAVALDAMQTAARIGDVLDDLFERTGVRAFAFFTRGDPDDPAVPHIVDSDNARAYFQRVFGKSFIDFLRKFEQWSCTLDTEVREKNDADSVRKQIVTLVLEGLRKIKNKKHIGMDYVNYKADIQHKLGVELAGWPSTILFVRPLKLRAEQAREIRDGLRSGTIRWVALSKAQRRDLAEELEELVSDGPLKRRKERSDKGKKRARHEDGSDTEEEEEEDEEDEEEEEDDDDDGDDDDDDNEQTPVTATTTAAPRVARRAPAPKAVNANPARTSNPSAARVSNAHANAANAPPVPNAHAPNVHANTRVPTHTPMPTDPAAQVPDAHANASGPHVPNAQVPNVHGPHDPNMHGPHDPNAHANAHINAHANTQVPHAHVPNAHVPNAHVPNAYVPNVEAAQQVFAAANNAGTAFDLSGVNFNVPLEELLPEFAQGAYGMPPLPNLYQGGGAFYGDAGSGGGDSYGLPPLPNSHHFGGAFYSHGVPPYGTHNGGGSYGMPPSSNAGAMEGFQEEDAALNAAVQAAFGMTSAASQPTGTVLINTTNTDEGAQKKRKRAREDAGDADGAKKQRKAKKKDAASGGDGAPKCKSKKAAATGGEVAPKRKSKKATAADGASA
ncbi:hypothetical protein B0H19DRAFT_1266549 [Mycena capillaripes]|nr:hypothetical protein B0H19DRAFT_1266549 [Mycena capillaripes]